MERDREPGDRRGEEAPRDPGKAVCLTSARPADAGALRRLADGSLPDAWSVEAFREELSRPDARGWLAHRGDALVGYLLLRLGVDAAEILSTAVRLDQRRQGVGRALVGRALVVATAEGRPRVDLELRASNRDALALYEALGFVVVGRRPRYYRDGEDALLMTHFSSGTPRLQETR